LRKRMETKLRKGDAEESASDPLEKRRRALFTHAALRSQDIDSFVIRSPYNRYYLSGFWGSEGFLIVRPDTSYLIVDSRYEEIASALQTRSLKVLHMPSSQRLMPFLGETLKAAQCERVAFESHLVSVADAENLKKIAKGISWVPVEGVVEKFRLIKTAEEIEQIRAASRVMMQVIESAWGLLKEGVTEKEIADEIEYQVRKAGAQKVAFDTIVLFGENTSKPHGVPTHRKLRAGDVVTIDAGAVNGHYCTDITRTIFFGNGVPPEARKVYEIVAESQRRGVEAIGAGKKCKSVDRAARGFIARNGYGDRFGHGLGHGVGIEIHEAPRLNQFSEEVLAPNMVVTVEPGIYLPGKFGVRIEDTVRVTRSGAENLTGSLSRSPVI
jgi:Xaa-Pro aminopeptidase